MNEHILVTGAAGFLGSVVLQKLYAAQCRITALIRPATDLWRIRPYISGINLVFEKDLYAAKYFKDQAVTTIVHTATNYGRNAELLHAIAETNIVMPLRLLEEAYSQGVRKFINCDSFYNKTGKVYNAAFSYSLSKLQYLQWMKFFASNNPGIYLNLILEHIYGERDSQHKFIPHLIELMKKKVSKIELTSCEVQRDFIYVGDVAEAIKTVIFHKLNECNEVIDLGVGTGKSVDLKSMVILLAEVLNYTGILDFGALNMRAQEILKSEADLKTWNNIKCHWNAAYSVEDGVKKILSE